MATNNVNDFSNPIAVSNGGTGVDNTTAYGLICGGTTTTGALQNAGTGTIGQILTSAGSSSLPIWSTPTSGSWVLLQTITANNTTGTIIFDDTIITSSYVNYVFVINALITASAQILFYQCSTDNGSTFETFDRSVNTAAYNSNSFTNVSTSTSNIRLYSNSKGPFSAVIFFYQLSGGKIFSTFQTFGNGVGYAYGSGYSTTTTAINEIQFFSAANWTSGTISCYGIVS